LRFNEVAHFERPEQENEQSTRKVLKVATQGHTCRQSNRCKQGSEGSSVDAQGTDYSNDQKHDEHDVDKRLEESLYRGIKLPAFKCRCQKSVDNRYNETADEENDNGNQNILSCFHAEGNCLLNKYL